ncbi:adenosylhomocysteine nucleosidase [Rhodoferax sp. OV413]|uniref:5'-methylthioadenosine/adenosylhomocysteine nucleosidase n=1 Tax=Rhodoferax sp. OV413 TaxID=1855285 RepID=UPI00088E0AD2|nr:5'-methylthioadenosine/adenosylhomocysteine nucleosidase [Rhodoferax sp. OV413]SDO85670.1 adenosylhomocysteine nucleosidase [Rhodoferax sp. OV413]
MTLAILSALAEEQQGIFEQLQQPRRVQHAGRAFGLGIWHGQPVVLALSRIGKVAAATTATALIEKFGVDRIVFTGVAGGVGEGVQVGDVVVASGFVQHDMDAAPLFPTFEVPLYGRARFDCDPALTTMLLEATRAGVSSASGLFSLNHRLPQVHHGLVASGDRFVSAATEVQRLQAALRAGGFEALAVEMEGAAVAQVCHDYGIPFAVVRTISDRADDTAHVDFPSFVSTVASRYAQAILAEFVQRL